MNDIVSIDPMVKVIPAKKNPERTYIECQDIRIIVEEGIIVGWYRPGRADSE